MRTSYHSKSRSRLFSFCILFYLLMIPLIFPLINISRDLLTSNGSIDDLESDKEAKLEELHQHSELIDDIYTREEINLIDLNNSVNMVLNDSSFCSNLVFNVSSINETRDYVENGQFDNNIDNWGINEEEDVTLYWKTNEPKSIGLNITGIESTNLLRPMDNWSGIEKFEDLYNWTLKNTASSNFWQEITDEVINSPSPTKTLMHKNSGTQNIKANSSFSFHYNGSSLSSANLSLWFRRKITGLSTNDADLDLIIYLILPNKTNRVLWTNFTHFDSNFDDNNFIFKKFTDLNQYFKEQGNYTIRFFSKHNATESGAFSHVYFDDIELNISYTAKEINNSDTYAFYETSYYNRTTLNDGTLNFSYYVPDKFEHINKSFINLSFWINNMRYNIDSMDQIENNTWIDESLQINHTDISGYNLTLKFGLLFNDSTSIYPNETMTLYFDNISFMISAEPTPSQIDLKINSTVDKIVYEIKDYVIGDTILSLSKSNSYWMSGNIYQFDLLTNTTGVEINLNLISTIISWRDVLIIEFEKIFVLLNQTFESITDLMIDTMANISYDSASLSEFLDILDLLGQGEITSARKKCTLISPTFENYINLVINMLNLYLDQNNGGTPLENSSIIFSQIHSLFESLSQNKDNLELITQRINQELSTLENNNGIKYSSFIEDLEGFTSTIPTNYPINDIINLIWEVKQQISDSFLNQREVIQIPMILNSPKIGGLALKINPNRFLYELALGSTPFPLLFQYIARNTVPLYQLGYSPIPTIYQTDIDSCSIKDMVLTEQDKEPFFYLQVLLDYAMCYYGNKLTLDKFDEFLIDGISNTSNLAQLDKDLAYSSSETSNFIKSNEFLNENLTIEKKQALQGETNGVLLVKNDFFIQNGTTRINLLNSIYKTEVNISANSSIRISIPIFSQNSIINMYLIDIISVDRLNILPMIMYQELSYNGEIIHNFTKQVEVNNESGDYIYFPEEMFFNLSVHRNTESIEFPIIIGVMNGDNSDFNLSLTNILTDIPIVFTRDIHNKSIKGHFDYFTIKFTLPNLHIKDYSLNFSLKSYENGELLPFDSISVSIHISNVYSFDIIISSSIFVAFLIMGIIIACSINIIRIQQRFFIKNAKFVRKIESELIKEGKS